MKNLRYILPMAALACIVAACNKQLPRKDACDGIACTMMFAMIAVEIEDNAGKPVQLDSFYTIRTSTGEKLYYNSGGGTEGSYVILDDGYQKKLVNSSDKFEFAGYKNGKQVVNEPYSLSADCCHIKRNAGREKIIIP